MERTNDSAVIETALVKAGFKASRINNDVTPTYLPPIGKFIGWEIIGGGEVDEDGKVVREAEQTANLRLITEDGCSISIGSIKALAFAGEEAHAKFREVDNVDSPLIGKFVLIGTTPINPHLSGKMAVLTARLVGKDFEAKPVPRITLRYKREGYASETEAREALTTKDFYHITLK